MSEFSIVQHPTYSPTACVFCGRSEGQFINTNLQLHAYGHLWICVGDDDRPGCITQAARLTGMLDATIVEQLRTDLRDAVARIAVLEEELEGERDKILVSREELEKIWPVTPRTRAKAPAKG